MIALSLALCFAVFYSEAYWIRIANCTSFNSGNTVTYLRDFSDSIIQSLASQSDAISITHPSDSRNVTAYGSSSYPLQELQQNYGAISHPIGGGIASQSLVNTTWVGDQDLTNSLWNSCDMSIKNEFDVYAFKPCGNIDGLGIGNSVCAWDVANRIDQSISIYLSVPNFTACMVQQGSCAGNASCTYDPPPSLNYTCACDLGYSGDPFNSCVDINACVNTPCAANFTCQDYPPPRGGGVNGRLCCSPGYVPNSTSTLVPNTCVDVDACIDNPCVGAYLTCTDNPAPALDDPSGRNCTCIRGTNNASGTGCQDINACASMPCSYANQTCWDKPPPFLAGVNGRLCCFPGFTADNVSSPVNCTDINACISYPCMGNATCTDLPAPAFNDSTGRTCACNTGYAMNGQLCQDINACISTPCQAGEVCTDFAPPALGDATGRVCCGPGTITMGLACQDINACINNPCGSNAICQDNPAPALDNSDGRVCSCNTGYAMNGIVCQDINACINNPCMANAACSDQPAPALDNPSGRVCTCTTGYQMNGTACNDINACLSNPCINATCQDLPPPAGNTPNDRTCTCNPGYEMKNGMCTDIDACLSVGCGINARCFDLPPPALNLSTGRQCTCTGTYTADSNNSCTVCNATKIASAVNSSCCNQIQDADETGTDCGGQVCHSCGLGVSCLADSDCQSGNICSKKICAASTGGGGGNNGGGLTSQDIIIIVVVIVAVFVIGFCCFLFYPRKKEQEPVKKKAVRVKSPLRDSAIFGNTPLRPSVEMNGAASGAHVRSDTLDNEDDGRMDESIPRASGGSTEGVKLLTPPQGDRSPLPDEKINREVSSEEIARLRVWLAENQLMTQEQAEGIPVDILHDLLSEGCNLEETFAVCRELHAQGVRLEKLRPAGEPSNPKRVKTTYNRTYRVVRQKNAHLVEEEQARQSSGSSGGSGAKRQIKKPPPLSPLASHSQSIESPSFLTED